jgi:hypothetical protein
MNPEQLHELYQALETELGSVRYMRRTPLRD